jgi:RHS repeat-associated protein
LGYTNDPGNDADPANPDRKYIPEDVIGYSINYHNNDFRPIATSPIDNNKYQSTDLSTTGAELFNGNIRATSYVNKVLQNGVAVGYSYRYDQLNRLMKMRRHDIANDGSDWGNSGIVSGYREDLSYDANGNIQTLNRFGSSEMINEMSYVYKATNNQLLNVNDTYSPQSHYTYDAIGNLIQEGDQAINWTLYGKIKNIVKPANTIAYRYDPSGNRITKTVGLESTHYVRDAQGNVIAAYEANNSSGLKLTEQHLYGSSRLGLFKRGLEVQSTGVNTYIGHDSYISGNKFFELNNHLGNVLATISDKKIGVASESDPLLVDHYKADIKTGQDYYPFGMLLTDWAEKAKDYRYGFNGQEMSNEIKGIGNSYTAQFWEYDSRIGRRWNIDPVGIGTNSGYHAFMNNPLLFIDPLGLDTVTSSKKAKDIGDVFQHQKGNSNFFWNKTADGYEGGGSSEQLSEVVVTAKIKRGRNWINYPNSTLRERKQWDIDQRNYRLGDFSRLTPQQIARYQSWDKAESDYRALSYGGVGIIIAPLAAVVAVESGVVGALYQVGSLGLRNYGWNFAAETVKEFSANRFQWRKMDWADVMVSTATSKMSFWGQAGAEMFNATNDFTIQEGWKNTFMPNMSGYNKAISSTLIDGGFGILKLSTHKSPFSEIWNANLDQLNYEVNSRLENH